MDVAAMFVPLLLFATWMVATMFSVVVEAMAPNARYQISLRAKGSPPLPAVAPVLQLPVLLSAIATTHCRALPFAVMPDMYVPAPAPLPLLSTRNDKPIIRKTPDPA